MNRYEAVVRLLVEKVADVAMKDDMDYGRTPLHEAVVRLLVEKGADVSAKTHSRWTALHEAAMNWHEAAMRQLMEGDQCRRHMEPTVRSRHP
jgi:ankyrin repeat protein